MTRTSALAPCLLVVLALGAFGCGAGTGNAEKTQPVGGFTLNEYRMYRAVISSPSTVSEQQALQNVATQYGAPVEDVRKAADKVQNVLFQNKWFGTPESEIRHASDWKGETR